MLNSLKAVVAAVVGFGATWIAGKFGFELTPEVQGTIVGAIMGLVVYFVPNISTPTP